MQVHENHPIPAAHKAESLPQYVRDVFLLLKKTLPQNNFIEIMSKVGIQSRVRYRKFIAGKQPISSNKLNQLSDALDLSFTERNTLTSLREFSPVASENGSAAEYYTCNSHVLSHPINTIILSLCSLPRKTDEAFLCRSLAQLFTDTEVYEAIALLLESQLIFKNKEGILRSKNEVTLSTLPGIKVEHSRSYIIQSLRLAEKNYDLDLSKREYTAFSTHINREDMPKLKDLIRQLRRSTYELSNDDANSVIHVNVNAFLISGDAQNEQS